MKKISSYVLWVLMAVSVAVMCAVFFGGDETALTSTGGETTAPAMLDALLYWIYAVVAIGVVSLVGFALKTLATMFQSDSKAAIKSLGSVIAFVVVMVVCYVASPAKEFSRIVNGEVQTFSEATMKTIDMWLFSNYILIGATVLLIIVFAVLRLIKK